MSEPEFEDFPSAVVGTISTGVMLVHDFSQVHACIEWIIGAPVWTHHLPKLHPPLQRAIKEQFPDMPTEMDGVDRENWRRFASDIEARFGKTLSVRRGDGSIAMGPLEGLPDNANVIVVETP